MAGGEGNPLRARALYLGDTLCRIHGTNQPSTIGTFVSSGCIRLTNRDIVDLYARVGVGTRVVVLPGQPPAAAVRSADLAVGARPVMWSLNGLPEARVVLYAGPKEVARYEGEGVWALFRLMDAARKENAGPTAIKATFGEGAQFATFKVHLPSGANPFSRGGLWSFRCPGRL